MTIPRLRTRTTTTTTLTPTTPTMMMIIRTTTTTTTTMRTTTTISPTQTLSNLPSSSLKNLNHWLSNLWQRKSPHRPINKTNHHHLHLHHQPKQRLKQSRLDRRPTNLFANANKMTQISSSRSAIPKKLPQKYQPHSLT